MYKNAGYITKRQCKVCCKGGSQILALWGTHRNLKFHALPVGKSPDPGQRLPAGMAFTALLTPTAHCVPMHWGEFLSPLLLLLFINLLGGTNRRGVGAYIYVSATLSPRAAIACRDGIYSTAHPHGPLCPHALRWSPWWTEQGPGGGCLSQAQSCKWLPLQGSLTQWGSVLRITSLFFFLFLSIIIIY